MIHDTWYMIDDTTTECIQQMERYHQTLKDNLLFTSICQWDLVDKLIMNLKQQSWLGPMTRPQLELFCHTQHCILEDVACTACDFCVYTYIWIDILSSPTLSTHIHTYTHTYTYIHINTHTYTYIHNLPWITLLKACLSAYALLLGSLLRMSGKNLLLFRIVIE